MITAAVLFAITLIGGIVMASIRIFKKAAPPLWFAVLHGAAAATGLIVFVTASKAQVAPDIAVAALASLLIAALGGYGLFILYFATAGLAGATLFIFYRLKHKELPIPLAVVHVTLAAISFVTLVVLQFR